MQTLLVALTVDSDADPVALADAVHARLDEVYPVVRTLGDLFTAVGFAQVTDRRVVVASAEVIAHVLSAADVSIDGGPAEGDVALLDAASDVVRHLQVGVGPLVVTEA